MTAPAPTPGPPAAPPRRPNMAAVRRAVGYLKHHRLDAAGALGALLLVSAATLATPQLVRMAVDGGIGGRDARVVLLAVGGLLGAALVRGVFSFAQGYLS